MKRRLLNNLRTIGTTVVAVFAGGALGYFESGGVSFKGAAVAGTVAVLGAVAKNSDKKKEKGS